MAGEPAAEAGLPAPRRRRSFDGVTRATDVDVSRHQVGLRQRFAAGQGGPAAQPNANGRGQAMLSGKVLKAARRAERLKSARAWSCMDSCCWSMGNISFVWFVLMVVYHLMPRDQIQYIQEAFVGAHEIDPPGARLAKEGLRAKHPVVFVPGIVTGGLELWEGRSCADDLFRKRLWGGTFGEAYKRPLCWLEHMLLDNLSGLDPPGVRLRAVSGLVAADYFMPGVTVWAVIIEQLARLGYDERSMHMAAYDWRLSFKNTEYRDQTLSRLKATIEMLVKTNNGQKVLLIPHSMGSLLTLFFLKWVEAPQPMGAGGGADWVANHIHALYNIAGPLLGAPKAFTGLFSAEAKDVAVLRTLDPGVFGSMQALQHVMRVSRTWDSTMSMLPKGGEKVWGDATWAPEDSFNCSRAREKGNGAAAAADVAAATAAAAAASTASEKGAATAAAAVAAEVAASVSNETSASDRSFDLETSDSRAWFGRMVSFSLESATLPAETVCPQVDEQAAAAAAAAGTCSGPTATCASDWSAKQHRPSDPCSCVTVADHATGGEVEEVEEEEGGSGDDDEIEDNSSNRGAEEEGGEEGNASSSSSSSPSRVEPKSHVRGSRRRRWQRRFEETVSQHLQSSNTTCGDVWTEYHDMHWRALREVADCPVYTAGGEGEGARGGVLGLLRKVAPKMMKRADENWSYGVADDLDDPKYQQPKYWSNPLETTLPLAPSLQLFCAYGTGILTERAYVYRMSPTNDSCIIPFRIDAAANAEQGQAGDCLRDGAYFSDGDETVPTISNGLPCAKLWRGKTRFNPSGAAAFLREFSHTPSSSMLPGRNTQSGSHVDIMGNSAMIEDILRVAAGTSGEDLGGDQIHSDIMHWASRVDIKL